jgi:hypothetical protein
MDDVAHDVDRGVFPGNQVAVVPDFGCGLDGHGGLRAPSAALGMNTLQGNAN